MLGKFFYMHKSDRRVILTLLAIAAVALTVIYLAGGKDEASTADTKDKTDSIGQPALAATADDPDRAPITYAQPAATPERFPFDPNTADSSQLLRLGLQPWQVRNIYKYRAAGGVYRQKEDFARLYGLTVKQYRELAPYIRIAPDYLPASSLFPSSSSPSATVPGAAPSAVVAEASPSGTPLHLSKLTPGETIELATADTTALKRIPGIGSYYARRIIDYGQRLGGYTSLSQLNEIEDFPQEALPYLTLSTAPVRRLNINTLSLNELKRHPYINFYQARAITDYRRRNGPISNLNELHLLPDFPPEAIERLLPYVEY
ncbi:MAG: helix-hairpin-helix domain-containing protein [Prevotella sp.]|nr:helix-hairpin-helix domain-containing protein [Prevotella sp.]